MKNSCAYTRSGYEVAGMDFIATYLNMYTYSLLRGVSFKVLPLSSYAFSPMRLPLLETLLELLLWNSFKCHCHIFWMSSISWNLHPFNADIIFENNQKSCFIFSDNFW